MFKKITSLFIVVLVIASLLSCTASAASSLYAPYVSYEYNEFDEAIVSPISYTLKETIDTSHLGLDKAIMSPSAIKYANNKIYLLDSGNSRILEIDSNYELVKEYNKFTIDAEYAQKNNVVLDKDGFVTFTNADGFDVTDKEFIVADTTGNRVLRIGFDSVVKSVIFCPEDALNDTKASFAPRAVVVDDKGRLYVSSTNIALGLFIFDENEQFVEFFGANEVLSTTQAITKFIRDLFFSITQMESVEQATPVTIYEMDFDDNGFMYTVSPYRDAESARAAVAGLIRKLNYYGDDLYAESVVFGDIEASNNGVKTWFADVDVDEDGFINLLDNNHGRVFQYTDTGTLIAVFGSAGDQSGCFAPYGAQAIETIGSDILVVDGKKNCIFVFEATEYTKAVRSAVLKMNNNDLEGSTEEWKALLRSNSNSYLCYQGLGRIADYNGDYAAAMDYFERAYDQEEYALAFQQQRQLFIQDNAIWVILAIVVLVVLVMIGLKFLGKLAVPAEGQAYSRLEGKYLMPLYVLTHPIDGFAQFKVRKHTSMRMSAIIAFSWLVIKILEYNFTGFAFEINRDVDFNMPVTMLLTVGLYVMFCIANWAICTLFEGKGTIKDIFATTAYSLIPYIVCLAIRVVLTNVLVPSESVFIEIIMTIGIIWSAGVLILGMLTIHDFTVAKTIGALILTLLGIVAIVFLVIMLYSLLKQMFSFFVSLYKEIDFRYL